MITLLKYGNTNTYFINGLLVDTDTAGTLYPFRRELKRKGITPDMIKYVLATHWHPDHVGLVGELVKGGAKLLLPDFQKEYVHSSDYIFIREKNPDFVPADESKAAVITAEESRDFLKTLGISGQIVRTASHSSDGAALVLDDGNAFVGDLEPLCYLGGYTENTALQNDWERLAALGADKIHYAHIPDKAF